MGRPPTCICGTCALCVKRVQQRERYQALSIDERRALIARRDADKVRARDRERYKREAERARLTANTRRWRQENPEKAQAHRAVAYAKRTGRLIAEPCEVCGDENVHAHHDDYSKPLNVRWLCPLHHHGSHAEGRRAA